MNLLRPEISRPQDMPELRQWLQAQWAPGALYWSIAQMTAQQRAAGAVVVNEAGETIDPDDDRFIYIEASFDDKALKGCPLYWVTEEMCELIATAAKTLPPTTLVPELMPSATGLVWFAQPLQGMAAHDVIDRGEIFHTLSITAMLWGQSMVPPGPHEALGISTYLVDEGVFSPAGRTDWNWGVDSDAPISEAISGDQQRIESMAEDRRWLATLWLLLAQSGVAETSLFRPQRQTIRRVERAQGGTIPREQFDVRVVNVHQPKERAESSGEHREIDWQRRWIVKPHWRQQAYGPNHSLRRPTLIGPYVKGPADKPLVVSETVQVLKDGEL